MNKRKSKKKTIVRILAVIVIIILVIPLGYVAYMQSQYYRIPDNTELEIVQDQSETLTVGQTYTAVTYNIGFGAYGPEYTFFMDTGEMNDGTKTKGKYGKAISKESVEEHTKGAENTLKELNADFYMLQEVDIDATRSYHVNQKDELTAEMNNYGSVFANNFHSAYLCYPFQDPHGAVEAGLLNFSRYHISEAVRRSYPVDEGFYVKFTDLDRCFAVMRVPVDNGHELVLINNHMSAYDEGGKIREQQLALLNQVMKDEYDAGNYVIVGGDFNHALGAEVAEAFPSEQKLPDWVSVLTDEDLADGIKIQKAENQFEVSTCRGSDIPYEKGVTFVTVVDGFLVSDNVKAVAENIDTEFADSDHNPVKLSFQLIK